MSFVRFLFLVSFHAIIIPAASWLFLAEERENCCRGGVRIDTAEKCSVAADDYVAAHHGYDQVKYMGEIEALQIGVFQLAADSGDEVPKGCFATDKYCELDNGLCFIFNSDAEGDGADGCQPVCDNYDPWGTGWVIMIVIASIVFPCALAAGIIGATKPVPPVAVVGAVMCVASLVSLIIGCIFLANEETRPRWEQEELECSDICGTPEEYGTVTCPGTSDDICDECFKPSPPLCPATPACGTWSAYAATGCQTKCDSEAGSGTPGRVTCSKGIGGCDPATIAEANICPATAQCGIWVQEKATGCKKECGFQGGTPGRVTCSSGSESACDAELKPAPDLCEKMPSCGEWERAEPSGCEDVCDFQGGTPGSVSCSTGEDSGCDLKNKPQPKTCPKTPSCGYKSTKPTGCESWCGQKVGDTGIPGNITCTKAGGDCDKQRKPTLDTVRCPATAGCFECIQGSSEPDKGKIYCNGRETQRSTKHEPMLLEVSTGYETVLHKQRPGQTLVYKCRGDSDALVTYTCNARGQLCTPDVCAAPNNLTCGHITDKRNVALVHLSCQDETDTHNGPKCVEILGHLQARDKFCDGITDDKTGCRVEIGVTLLFGLNLSDLIYEIIVVVYIGVQSIGSACCETSCFAQKGLRQTGLSAFAIFMLAIDFSLALGAFCTACIALPSVNEFVDANCFVDGVTSDTAMQDNLYTIVASGSIELLLGLLLIGLKVLEVSGKVTEGGTVVLVIVIVCVDVLEFAVTCTEFYFTWEVWNDLQDVFEDARRGDMGIWCFGCQGGDGALVDAATTSWTNIGPMVFILCVGTALWRAS